MKEVLYNSEMEAQKCKICGARHHRYEPHRFAAPAALGKVLMTRGPRRPEITAIETEAIAPPDYASFSDADLRVCYNAVMKEVMRRRRRRPGGF